MQHVFVYASSFSNKKVKAFFFFKRSDREGDGKILELFEVRPPDNGLIAKLAQHGHYDIDIY